MKYSHHWFETVDQFAISVTVCLELVGFVCKEVEDTWIRSGESQFWSDWAKGCVGRSMVVCLA